MQHPRRRRAALTATRKHLEADVSRPDSRVCGLHVEDPHFGKMLDAVPQLVWTASVDGRLLYSNIEARQRLGRCEGRKLEDVIPANLVCAAHRKRWLATWRRALRSGQAYEIEYAMGPNADGSTHWYLERGARTDLEADSDRWIVTATRIDEQKRREEELLDVLLRKERFLVTLLHELRNPLAPIANATTLLARHSADPHAVSSAHAVIQRQLGQLTRLVDDLLDHSRLARGRIALQRAPTDLCDVIAMAIETAQPLIEGRGHRLAINIPSAPIIVDADKERLCQVFANLLINAAKYTNPGGRITVSLRARRGCAFVKVRDNGIGIPPDLLPRIFEMFAQASPGTQTAMGGLGVGLAVARQLIQLHAGTLSAYSDGQGCGSEFVVRLPCLVSERSTEGH